jgi:hypothetical protein
MLPFGVAGQDAHALLRPQWYRRSTQVQAGWAKVF